MPETATHAPPAILRVEPLTTTRSLKGPFDYLRPEGDERIGVGSILQVPFGRQRLLGVVTAVTGESELPLERLATPLSVMGDSVPADLVELAGWIAAEYCSTPARALELMLPPGTSLARGAIQPKLITVATIAVPGLEALDGEARFGAKQRLALEALATAGEVGLTTTALRDEHQVARATLNTLAEKGLIELTLVPVHRAPEVRTVGAPDREVELNSDQRRVVDEVVASLDSGGGSFLLHGVTGSGKTEVYLAAAQAALDRGRGVIVLVPEIGLTPQTMSRFRSRLGETVALMHSGLSEGERADEWRRLRSGQARVCVGPRSAVFAPVTGLGLVIVDEEHDSSYKQENDPRYDARDVAVRRAEASGATLVAGTATPRPESWISMRRLDLPKRATGSGVGLPRIEVLDMRVPEREEGRSFGRADFGPLHPRSRQELAALAQIGGKAIIMVPRRGWSLHLACNACGHVWQCPNCDVSLVFHQEAGVLRCHHCGHRDKAPEVCTECGSVGLSRSGVGSERLASELTDLVAPLPVFRLDADSARRKGAHAEILGRFDDAESGVLVGTQMVTKGHDFPDVVLGIVLDADAALRFPDFRAEERTFALITQLAGRSGRGPRGGMVLVQTLAPEAEAIERAAVYDTAGFLEGEIERRRQLSYPPAGHLVKIELTSADPDLVAKAGETAAAELAALLPAEDRLLGPAPRFRRRGKYRRQLLIKSPERAPTVTAVGEALEKLVSGRALRDVSISVDVDPQ